MSTFSRLAPAFLAVTSGIATAYYVITPEYEVGGAGAEVIPQKNRPNTVVAPVSSSSSGFLPIEQNGSKPPDATAGRA
ncbi:uncharacterized protein L203_101762 [Cryptococcus depauperatus CBS 7841]|uniref:Uncharacterized protein n=1 Tax=Cryptococcus depauperatus CBS 7841 TaxID=1295531 RepID=A0A1E3HP50_9TREE|nr:hypothetical protein L203_06186 [Cryptococcus depauperatus CBS 7841]